MEPGIDLGRLCYSRRGVFVCCPWTGKAASLGAALLGVPGEEVLVDVGVLGA